MNMTKRVHALAAVYAIAASAVLSLALAGPAMAVDRVATAPAGHAVVGAPIERVAPAASTAVTSLVTPTTVLAVEQPADPNKKNDVKEPVAAGAADTQGLLLLAVGLGAIVASIVLVVRAGARRSARNF